MRVPILRIDIEPTNRCNADCYFCPREMTPDEGLLKPDVFAHAFERVLELRRQIEGRMTVDYGVTLCGLGEPLINKHTPSYIRQIRDADIYCAMSSNGALLDERRAEDVLDAGLNAIHLNVGDLESDYEDIYKLPWERTRDNVLRFRDLAEDRCEVRIVLVNHRDDQDYVNGVRSYWESEGFEHFDVFGIMNRGGSLVRDGMTVAYDDEERAAAAAAVFDDDAPPCLAPFIFPFIGYDGDWYLCCSDWTKTVSLGNVTDTSFVDTIASKLSFVESRSTPCDVCSIDPINQIADLQATGAGPGRVDVLKQTLVAQGEQVAQMVEILTPDVSATARKAIPVRSR